jgi:hypothetical protein
MIPFETRHDTLLGVINGVQVEVSGVGGDAIHQHSVSSTEFDVRKENGELRIGEKKEGRRRKK